MGVLARLGNARALALRKARRAKGARGGRAAAAPATLFTSVPDIIVITGRGNRSRTRGQPVVRHAVLAFLQALGLPVRLGAGNDGVVVVRGADVERLLDEARARGVAWAPAALAHALVGRAVEPPPQPPAAR